MFRMSVSWEAPPAARIHQNLQPWIRVERSRQAVLPHWCDCSCCTAEHNKHRCCTVKAFIVWLPTDSDYTGLPNIRPAHTPVHSSRLQESSFFSPGVRGRAR